MLGHAVRDIARTFVVSEATVRTQVKSILSKLEVSSQLAAVAADLGLRRALERPSDGSSEGSGEGPIAQPRLGDPLI
eukprot:gene35196-39812_t